MKFDYYAEISDDLGEFIAFVARAEQRLRGPFSVQASVVLGVGWQFYAHTRPELEAGPGFFMLEDAA